MWVKSCCSKGNSVWYTTQKLKVTMTNFSNKPEKSERKNIKISNQVLHDNSTTDFVSIYQSYFLWCFHDLYSMT